MNIMEMKIIHSKRKETCGRIFKCENSNIIYKFSVFNINPTPDCVSESLGNWFMIKHQNILLEKFHKNRPMKVFGFDNGDSMSFCGLSNSLTPFQVNRYDPPKLYEWDLLPYSEVSLDYRYNLDSDSATTDVWLQLACRDMNMPIISFDDTGP